MKSVVFKLPLVFRLSSFVFVIFSLFTIHSSLFTPNVHAQCAPPATTLPLDQLVNQMNKCFIEKSQFEDKAFETNAVIGTANGFSALITGGAPATPAIAHFFQNNNALASTGTMIASIYGVPPASGVTYFAQQFQKLNPVQPAYAQTGIGFSALSPIQALWTAFRNISYVGFVFVFIIIGFMIMLRAKISPQAVATVQDSIPRIVIALILVTFSYAIVGLVIDFMFLFLNVMMRGLETAGVIDFGNAENAVFQNSIIGAIVKAWPDIVVETAKALNSLINSLGILGTIATMLSLGSIGLIAGLIVGIAALFIMFKILFMLLMAYVSIVILTIFAPFILLFQALPGNNGAQGWFKQLIANISVFPVAALMLILAGVFAHIGSFGFGGAPTRIDASNIGQFPLIAGGIDTDTVSRLIGLGFLFMIPSAAGMIKERLKAGGGIAFGGAGAAALGSAGGWAGAVAARNPISRAGTELYKRGGEEVTARAMAKFPGVGSVNVNTGLDRFQINPRKDKA